MAKFQNLIAPNLVLFEIWVHKLISMYVVILNEPSDRYSATLTLYCHSNTVMQLAHCACARMPRPTFCFVLLSSLLLIILSYTRLWIVFTSNRKGIQHHQMINRPLARPAGFRETGNDTHVLQSISMCGHRRKMTHLGNGRRFFEADFCNNLQDKSFFAKMQKCHFW